MGRAVIEREDGFYNVEGMSEDKVYTKEVAERVAKQMDAADEAAKKDPNDKANVHLR